ncbi:signal recognition particle-docking protein FtsY [Teredinibacter purpureus]|uniref:signal recognition particle-docking protein FtsY n=1 Tax=Teredinibacter purpureus TaxID=2731756 RepID=UPI0005F77C23|nr:signal recognition particle-docking protein FtsY [Teredinibacter purpureus]
MFFKRKKNTPEESSPKKAEIEQPQEKLSLLARMKRGLSRTSSQFSSGLATLLMGKKAINDELLEEIETLLLMADVGVDATTEIIDNLTERVARKQLADSDALFTALKDSLSALLQQVESPLVIDSEKKPYVILVVGVNGVGKTTTIGKLAKRLQNEGKSVMLAAGDTFRAAAVEQLEVWGERNEVPVVAQHTGADSASVIYDAVQSAQSRGIDVVIADTAGRLHNKSNLMEELSKVKRVMGKIDGTAPHEILLVLDAGTGQNAVSQTDHFLKAAGVTGLALTKLDGTAKGGIIFALSKKHQLPVRFIGVGEGIDDLQPFSASNFIDALFGEGKAE